MTFYYTFTAESDSERILKIGHHFAEVMGKEVPGCFFYETRCKLTSPLYSVF